VCGCFSETPSKAENAIKTGPKRLFLALTGPNRFQRFSQGEAEIAALHAFLPPRTGCPPVPLKQKIHLTRTFPSSTMGDEKRKRKIPPRCCPVPGR